MCAPKAPQFRQEKRLSVSRTATKWQQVLSIQPKSKSQPQPNANNFVGTSVAQVSVEAKRGTRHTICVSFLNLTFQRLFKENLMKKLIAAVLMVGLLTMGAFAQDKPADKPAEKKAMAKKAAPAKKEEAAAATTEEAGKGKKKAAKKKAAKKEDAKKEEGAAPAKKN
ncbi:MAG: hypothetical protein JNJ50_04030 [Acidobacteria bacterium]|nr:hypothetical protein [Acidobacteriota bacterium]